MIKRIFNNKEGKLQKLLVLIIITSLLFFVLIGINSAENVTESETDLPTSEEIIEETVTEEVEIVEENVTSL